MKRLKKVETVEELKEWNNKLGTELAIFKARRELATGGILSLLVPDPEHAIEITSECLVPGVDWIAAGPAEWLHVV